MLHISGKTVKRQQLNEKKNAAEQKYPACLITVLAPPQSFPPQKQTRRKQIFFKNEKHTANDKGVGYQWAASEHVTKGRMGASWKSVIKQNYNGSTDRRQTRRRRARGREGKLPRSYDLLPTCRGAFLWLSPRRRCSQMSQSRNPVVHGKG